MTTTERRSFLLRLFADLLIAFLAIAAFVASSKSADPTWIMASLASLLIAVGVVAYLEPSAKRVWIHPLLIMSPELIALPFARLTCRGFECGGVIGFLMAASLFAVVLVALSFVVFYGRLRIMRSGAR